VNHVLTSSDIGNKVAVIKLMRSQFTDISKEETRDPVASSNKDRISVMFYVFLLNVLHI
jgi:hypothetical protein